MKPRSKAAINPSAAQMAPRHVGRIKTLRAAIEKAKSRGQSERAASLKEELSRRLAEIQTIKAELDSL